MAEVTNRICGPGTLVLSNYLCPLISYQEPFLFSGTIEDNIADGLDAEVSNLSEKDMKERIETAARLANAHDFIMEFPEGYKTEVGSRGSSLSGGQKQRIGIVLIDVVFCTYPLISCSYRTRISK